jgi:hypothetical protein
MNNRPAGWYANHDEAVADYAARGQKPFELLLQTIDAIRAEWADESDGEDVPFVPPP